MNVLVFLVPISLIMAGLALSLFIWSLRNRQYEDLDGDAWRILLDEKDPSED